MIAAAVEQPARHAGHLQLKGDHRCVALSHSIPQPKFARKLPTKLPPPMDETFLRKVMVRSHRGSIGHLQSEIFSTPTTFRYGKTNFQTEVCSGSSDPNEAMPWIKEIELANSVDDIERSQSITGRSYWNSRDP